MMAVRRWLNIWGPLAVWCGLIYLLSDRENMDLQHMAPGHPSSHVLDYPLRKIGHLVEYSVLFVLARRGLPSGRAWLFCFVFAVTDEWHQTFIPGRTGRLSDIALDSVAAALPWLTPHVKKLLRRR